jgi:hypothetical protein
MRRDHDLLDVPERVIGGQRLGAEDIERGAADLTVADGGGERRLVDELAATDIDHLGPARQRIEHVAIDDAVRLLRERHDQNQDLRAREEILELIAAVERGDALDLFRRARPARHRKAQAQQLSRRLRAEMAEAHDADREGRALARMDVLPASLAALLLQRGKFAEVAQHRVQHVLRHHPVLFRIDEAHDRHARRQRVVLEDVVDAGADVHDELEVRILPHLARRCLPHHGTLDVGGVADIRMRPEVEIGHRALQMLAPVIGIVELAVEQHRSGHCASARSSRRCIASSANS